MAYAKRQRLSFTGSYNFILKYLFQSVFVASCNTLGESVEGEKKICKKIWGLENVAAK